MSKAEKPSSLAPEIVRFSDFMYELNRARQAQHSLARISLIRELLDATLTQLLVNSSIQCFIRLEVDIQISLSKVLIEQGKIYSGVRRGKPSACTKKRTKSVATSTSETRKTEQIKILWRKNTYVKVVEVLALRANENREDFPQQFPAISQAIFSAKASGSMDVSL